MTTTSTTWSNGKGCRQAFFPAIAILLLSLAPSANASTYLFSFDVSDALAALRTSEGAENFDKSAYFGLWVQPNRAVVTSYSYYVPGIVGPNTGNIDAWQATTITDYSSPNLGYSGGSPCSTNCTWVQFSKQDAQNSVMVLSGADPSQPAIDRGDFFHGATFADAVPPPFGWGATEATITSVYNGTNSNPTFQFVIETSLTLSGPVSIKGYASSLRSTSSTYFDTDPFFGTKEHDGIAFTLSVAPEDITGVPEPRTLVLMVAGAMAIGLLRLKTRKRHTAPPFQVDPPSC